MESDQEDSTLLLLLLSAAASGVTLLSLVKARRPRRWWVRPIYQDRRKQGDFHNLIPQMRSCDEEMFFHYTRLTVEQFDDLLSIVGPHIIKKSNRAPLDAGHRLAITLRFLATGCSLQSLAFQFRISKATACKVVHETAKAIWDSLHEKVFVKPTTQNWLKISQQFEQRWNFPHCIGALDGKHIRIQAPPQTGAQYYNYKQYFSVILMAICDASYKFTFVDIGAMGAENDSGVFNRTIFAHMLAANQLNIPPPSRIVNELEDVFPYFFVADEAFPLKENIMRPYPGQNLSRRQSVFNYRLSRARRIIENTFGILVSRWRIFQGPIIANVENVDKYILAAVCLHNYLKMWDETRSVSSSKYCPVTYVDRDYHGRVELGEWRQHVSDSQILQPLNRLGSNNTKKSVFEIRDNLAAYFDSFEGSVPWQETYIMRGIKRRRV